MTLPKRSGLTVIGERGRQRLENGGRRLSTGRKREAELLDLEDALRHAAVEALHQCPHAVDFRVRLVLERLLDKVGQLAGQYMARISDPPR